MRYRPPCAWIALVSFLVALTVPRPASAGFFDEDALKTTGIIIGIAFGVGLVIVLIAGTMHDIKGGSDDLGADLAQNPLLRCLGYPPEGFRLFTRTPGGENPDLPVGLKAPHLAPPPWHHTGLSGPGYVPAMDLWMPVASGWRVSLGRRPPLSQDRWADGRARSIRHSLPPGPDQP